MANKSLIFNYQNLIGKNGIKERVFEKYVKKSVSAKDRIDNLIKEGKLGFVKLINQDLSELKKFIKKNQKKYDNVVVLGIGGNTLGIIASLSALKPLNYNYLSKKERKGFPRLFVIDNVDPEFFGAVDELIDYKKTLFIVITKSGRTSETMAQFFIVYNKLLKKVGRKNINKHLIAVTDKEKGILLSISKELNLTTFFIPSDVGGRFSVLTPVGLLPLGLIGINIDELLKGASIIARTLKNKDIMNIPPYVNAILHYIADIKYKKKISVMMPYSNKLLSFADWYRQLWAESLGKMYNRNGKKVFTGQTPVKALGATDQHSQIQLYNEGPKDKIVTLIKVNKFSNDYKIPSVFKNHSDLKYLHKITLGKLLNTELEATEMALTKYGVFNCRIEFPEINENSIGQFIFFYEIQTAFAGELYNINAFDQPGVEEGKKNIKILLSK